MRPRCQIGEYWPSNRRKVCRDSGAGGVGGFECKDLSGVAALGYRLYVVALRCALWSAKGVTLESSSSATRSVWDTT